MSANACVALGPVESSQDAISMQWAFLAALRQRGKQVQVFRDQAHFATESVSHSVCGQSPRYLDSWLMSPSLCRETFAYGMSGADFGMVVGHYDRASSTSLSNRASLDPLCDWLDLPRLAVVNVSQANACRIPACPARTAGVLLDCVPRGKFIELQTVYESLWGVPVLGGLPELPELRAAIHRTATSQHNSCDLCQQLGKYLAATLRWNRLAELASRPAEHPIAKIFQPGHKLQGLRIAVAFDEAIDEYFPEVLELLELQGAVVQDFSLLRDQALPPDTDVVYLGGGRPEQFASTLAANQCMTLALHDHARQGRRVYAEGAGAALLCQHLQLSDGQQLPMLGLLPAIAKLVPEGNSHLPEEMCLAEDHWLGGRGSILRGYRNDCWQLDFIDSLIPLAYRGNRPQLYAWQQVVASMLHVNFAVQPGFLQRFSHSGAAAF
jgi:cobyrinic acid a,c-diamide synthase